MLPAAIIFDFDGVIVNTEPIHYQAFVEILKPIDLAFTWEEYQEKYMGFDDRDAFKEAFSCKSIMLSETELSNIIEKKALIFQEIISNGVTAYPGVIDLVLFLNKHNIPIAICSGALESDILPILKTLKIDNSFIHITTAEHVKKSKPDPECYNITSDLLINSYNNLNIKKSQIIVIEDTPAGIKAAKDAGLNVIAVTNSYPTERLIESDRIISNLNTLLSELSANVTSVP